MVLHCRRDCTPKNARGEEYGIHSSTPLVDVNLYDNQGMTALHYAASCGFLHMCELLLEEHADPNIPKQNNGFSALHFACENGHVNIAKLLVKQKAGGYKHTCMHGMLVICVCIYVSNFGKLLQT